MATSVPIGASEIICGIHLNSVAAMKQPAAMAMKTERSASLFASSTVAANL